MKDARYCVARSGSECGDCPVGISESRNQPTWPLGAARRFRAEKLVQPWPEVSEWHRECHHLVLDSFVRMEPVC
jgi:hypothetical protein